MRAGRVEIYHGRPRKTQPAGLKLQKPEKSEALKGKAAEDPRREQAGDPGKADILDT